MTSLPKIYDPHDIEGKWYKYWLSNNFFHAAATSDNSPYAIVIPPPNITGSLHIGHALDNTLQDCLIRWQRMQGLNTLWMPGTDHAGIVTELIMERKLEEEGSSRNESDARNSLNVCGNGKRNLLVISSHTATTRMFM